MPGARGLAKPGGVPSATWSRAYPYPKPFLVVVRAIQQDPRLHLALQGVPFLRGLMPGIVFRMQVSVGGRYGRVPEIVPHEAQVHLLAGHVRPRDMAQPVRRRAGQHRGTVLPLGAA